MIFLSHPAFEAIHERIRVLEAANATLVAQIIELKRDGFARPTPHLVQEHRAPALDDRIMASIRAIAPEGSSLERELFTYAQAQLLAEAEIEDIADAILAGSSLGDE